MSAEPMERRWRAIIIGSREDRRIAWVIFASAVAGLLALGMLCGP